MALQERVEAEVVQGRPTGVLSVAERPSRRAPRGAPASALRLHLLDSVTHAVAGLGYRGLSVERLAATAGVDPATFREHFAGPGAAVAAAYDAASERLVDELRVACASQSQWPLKVEAAVGAALAFATAQPALARLLCLDPLSVDAEVARHLLAGNERLAALLAEGRHDRPEAASLPRLTEMTLVNAALALIGPRLAVGDAVAELKPQLMQMLLRPYLEDAEA